LIALIFDERLACSGFTAHLNAFDPMPQKIFTVLLAIRTILLNPINCATRIVNTAGLEMSSHES